MSPFEHPPKLKPNKGFALVATISVMVLLAMIALSLLSLSTVSIRSTNQDSTQIQAQANARLALMLALSELQKSMGPDQNISSTAGILDTNPDSPQLDGVQHPYLTGVWKAREDRLEDLPEYDREKPFRQWLVSHPQQEQQEQMSFALDGSFNDPVLMVGPTTSDSEKSKVFADKLLTTNGAYAWWVGDENTKGKLNPRDLADRQGESSIANLLTTYNTPGAHGIKALEDFEDFDSNTATSDRIITVRQINLTDINQEQPSEFFHDLSPYPKSVLADVTQGTLRKDLSLYLERKNINWLAPWGAASGASSLPNAPLGPNDSIALSPPHQYDVLSWKSLHHWYNMHRKQVGENGRIMMGAVNNNTPGIDPVSNPGWNSGVLSPAPVVARIQMLMSYSTKKITSTKYRLFFYSYPVVTLWNPYNVSLTVPNWNIFLHTMPLEHTIHIESGGTNSIYTKYRWEWPHGNMVMRFGGETGAPSITFKPGEAKILNYTETFQRYHSHNMTTESKPWTRIPQHVGRPRNLGEIIAPGTARIRIETKAAKWETSGTSYQGAAFQTTFGFRCEPTGVHNWNSRARQQMFSAQVCWRREEGNPVTDSISVNNFPSKTLSELNRAPTPFIHLDLRLKTLDEIQLPNKTWLHNIPSHSYAAATSTKMHSSKGVDAATTFYAHPYTVSFEEKTSVAGLFQNVPFFGSSNTTTGQSRIAAQGIPLAPLTSLAQLQNLPQYSIEGLNWNGYYMQNNAIGNSYASPGLAPTKIKEQSFPFYLGQYFAWESGDITGKRYHNKSAFNGAHYQVDAAPAAVIDRSYAANHLLFDQHFFSSIASQEGPVFQNYGTQKSVNDIASEFYLGKTSLPNTAYQPYIPSGENPETIIDSLVSTSGGVTDDAYSKISGRLMTRGGFNINSTSIPAWTVLLASSHLKRPVTIEHTGLTAQSPSKFVVSRYSHSIGSPADNTAGLSSEQKRWLGYRELTTEEIRQLATAIVKQVKKRGPFRSLGEFINRRRSNDKDMALYGALQAALEDKEVKINDNYRSNTITAADIKEANYKFTEAALGSRHQGTPAYISQADILMPIAPIINARSDTFLIRAYGEARSKDGKTTVKAWCEAIIQRVPDYVDPKDSPETPSSDLSSPVNRQFGRKMLIQSFRWLAPQEI